MRAPYKSMYCNYYYQGLFSRPTFPHEGINKSRLLAARTWRKHLIPSLPLFTLFIPCSYLCLPPLVNSLARRRQSTSVLFGSLISLHESSTWSGCDLICLSMSRLSCLAVMWFACLPASSTCARLTPRKPCSGVTGRLNLVLYFYSGVFVWVGEGLSRVCVISVQN